MSAKSELVGANFREVADAAYEACACGTKPCADCVTSCLPAEKIRQAILALQPASDAEAVLVPRKQLAQWASWSRARGQEVSELTETKYSGGIVSDRLTEEMDAMLTATPAAPQVAQEPSEYVTVRRDEWDAQCERIKELLGTHFLANAFIVDRGDGVKGHYCIGRWNTKGRFNEYYNNGRWVSAGELFYAPVESTPARNKGASE